MENKKPLVSIICTVYNHEKYLRDCLNGFVTQKTDFPFVAIVHDDKSTDGSALIIQEYYEKYPNIIYPIFEDENQYSKGTLGKVMIQAVNSVGAEYVASCEGDDYWTDEDKLQKQVDFLRENREYSMCFHNALQHWEETDRADIPFADIQNRDYSGRELYEKWIVPTASIVCKAEVLNSEYYYKLRQNPNFCFGDILKIIACCHLGKVRGMDFIGSVYRRTTTGMLYNTTAESFYRHSKEIYSFIGGEYKEHARRMMFNTAHSLLKSKISIKSKLHIVFDCIMANPIKAIKLIITSL